MTMSTKKRIGFGFVCGAVLAGLLLLVFGIPLVTCESHGSLIGAKDGVMVTHVAFHWPLTVLMVVAMAGVLFARGGYKKAKR
jgi:hypothetical protein